MAQDKSLLHLLKYDRPHIYKCSCGYVQMIYITTEKVIEKTLESPDDVEYMPCGHAICANVNGVCAICANGAK